MPRSKSFSYPVPLFFFLIIISVYQPHKLLAQAKAWQWGKIGGSASDQYGGVQENIIDIATDNNGNVYFLANIERSFAHVDGMLINSYGNFDIIICSYDCNGQFRWKKQIGSAADDNGVGLGTDTLGHVYVAGYVWPQNTLSQHPTAFDTDSTLMYGDPKMIFVAQYDTSGNFQWLRMPQADTVTNYGGYANSGIFNMHVSPGGEVHLLTFMSPQRLSEPGNFIIPIRDYYILRYNSQGNLQNVIRPDMSGRPGYLPHTTDFIFDEVSNKYYFLGTYNFDIPGTSFYIGGQLITTRSFLGVFNSNGVYDWKITTHGGSITGVNADQSGNIYLTGMGMAGYDVNSHMFSNILGPHQFPYVMKITSNGSNLWAKNGHVNAVTSTGGVLVTGNEVSITGGYPGSLFWVGEDSLMHIMNQGHDLYLARFNAATGALTGLDTLASSFSADEFGVRLTKDKKGNYYIGGNATQDVFAGIDTLYAMGGLKDFFIAKYGIANCQCVLPVANYNSSVQPGGLIATFAYTGSPAPDSVKWDFGDGQLSYSINPTHTYAAAGNYNVCLKVYNQCGMDEECRQIQVTLGISEYHTGTEAVFPNPAKNIVMLKNVPAGFTYMIYNQLGRKVLHGKTTSDDERINIVELSAGIYVVEISDGQSSPTRLKLIKY